jgi:hypothetical protein
MRKKTLVILYTIGSVLSVLALIAEIPIIVWSVQCSNGTSVCAGLPIPAILGIVLAALFILAGSVLLLIAWIGMLVKQAKQQQWTWFICTILFSWIAMLIYLIKVPEVKQPPMVAYPVMPQPYASGFQPHPPQGERSMQQPQE